MKTSEFKKLIREEISKVLKEDQSIRSVGPRVKLQENFKVGDIVKYNNKPHIVIKISNQGKTKIKPLADGGKYGPISWESWINNKELKEGEETNDTDTTETPSAEPQLYVISYAYRTGKPDYDDYDFAYETIKAKSSSDALAQARKMFGGGLTINSSIEINTDATKHARAKLAKMSKEK